MTDCRPIFLVRLEFVTGLAKHFAVFERRLSAHEIRNSVIVFDVTDGQPGRAFLASAIRAMKRIPLDAFGKFPAITHLNEPSSSTALLVLWLLMLLVGRDHRERLRAFLI